jgi:hypothetical protein
VGPQMETGHDGNSGMMCPTQARICSHGCWQIVWGDVDQARIVIVRHWMEGIG